MNKHWLLFLLGFGQFVQAAPPLALLKYVGGDGMARQIWRKNRSLHVVNEDFSPNLTPPDLAR